MLNIGDNHNYFRFQTDLQDASGEMDNTYGENLQALRALGERLADGPAFAEVCTRLGAVIAERAVLNQGIPMPAAPVRRLTAPAAGSRPRHLIHRVIARCRMRSVT